MSETAIGSEGRLRAEARAGWIVRLAASPRFQAFAARIPGLRTIARAEGRAIFDIMAGFVNAQVLMALVELRVLERLHEGAARPDALAPRIGLDPRRAEVLLQASAALGLLRRSGCCGAGAMAPLPSRCGGLRFWACRG